MPTARVLQLNDDGSYVVEIAGQKFRALTRKQLDDWANMEVDLRGARAQVQVLEADNVELEKQKLSLTSERDQERLKFTASEAKVQSLTQDLIQSKTDTKRTMDLLTDSMKLNTQAQQFIPHSSAKGWFGRLLTALDRPEVQMAFKVGIPILNTARCQQ